MKTVLTVAGAVLLGAVLALASTFTAESLVVPPDFAVAIPEARSPAGMTMVAVHAGEMHSRAAFAYRGGSFGEARNFAMSAALIRHPQGLLLIDTGFGRNVDAQFQSTPFLMRAMSTYKKGTAVVDQLASAGITPSMLKAVILTHAHWDHVSGLPDLAGVPVWVTEAERNFIAGCTEPAALACSFGELAYRLYEFPDGPYLGFESSHDVFGDGSVVIVPTPGHTPGSVSVFVTLPDGGRFAFIGDTAWQKEGVDLPAERPWLPRRQLAEDAAAVRRWLVHFHQLQESVPGLVVVPAHDQRVFNTLPRLQ